MKIPFWLSNQRVGIVFIYENISDFAICREDPIDYHSAVKEFVKQMDDHWCVAFLECLHDEIERVVVEHWKEFAPERLQEEPYKNYKAAEEER